MICSNKFHEKGDRNRSHSNISTLTEQRSRGSTHRSRERPLGRPDSASVKLGNLLRILLILASSKHVWWVLEQPLSSVMQYHPLFQRIIALLGTRRMVISMANYGAPTEKKLSSIPVAFFFFGSFSGLFRCWFQDVSPKQRIWMHIVNPKQRQLTTKIQSYPRSWWDRRVEGARHWEAIGTQRNGCKIYEC